MLKESGTTALCAALWDGIGAQLSSAEEQRDTRSNQNPGARAALLEREGLSVSQGRTRTGTVQRKLGASQREKNASILAEELFFTSNVSWSVHCESWVRQSLEIYFLSAS